MCRFDIDWVESYVNIQVCMPSAVHERTGGSVGTDVMTQLALRAANKGVPSDSIGIELTGSTRAL